MQLSTSSLDECFDRIIEKLMLKRLLDFMDKHCFVITSIWVFWNHVTTTATI